MRIKFLRLVEANVFVECQVCPDPECCGYVGEWEEEFFAADEEVEAVAERICYPDYGVVCVEGLKYKEDYEIIEFP